MRANPIECRVAGDGPDCKCRRSNTPERLHLTRCNQASCAVAQKFAARFANESILLAPAKALLNTAPHVQALLCCRVFNTQTVPPDPGQS